MFIITGATGHLGHNIVQHLLRLVPAEQIAVSVRDPAKADALAVAGVRVRQADYEDATSLRHAWEGAKRLLLVSSNASATGANPLAQHATAIAVAQDFGVERIFYTSQIASSKTSYFPPARTHAATEDMLAASGLAWTALRHGFYAQSALAMNARGFASGSLSASADGKVSWTTHDDLAAADAMLLAGHETFDGPTPALTGSEALDLADLADIAQTVLGRPIDRHVISDEEMLSIAKLSGATSDRIAIMMGYYEAARAGEFAQVDPTLARLLGRRPKLMGDFMAEELK